MPVSNMRHSARDSRKSLRYAATVHPDRTAITAALLAWVLASWVPIPLLSILGTLPLVFWLPGAALLRLSRSARSPMITSDDSARPALAALLRLSHPERSPVDVGDIAISTALSAAVTIAVGLGLAVTTKHLPRVPAATVLAGLTVAFRLVAARMSPAFSGLPAATSKTGGLPCPARWVAATVIACCVLTGFLGYLSWRLYATPPPSDTYTVLSLDHQDNKTVIVVTNNQAITMRFRLKVSRGERTIANRTFRLKVGAEYKLKLAPPSDASSTSHNVARLMIEPNNKLYRSLTF